MSEATLRRDQIRAHLNEAWSLLIEAHRAGDHLELGYPSWAEYIAGEYPIRPQLARADRQEVFDAMLEAGMSQREIAAATGVDQKTVSNVSRSTSEENSSDDDHEPTTSKPDTPPRARPIKDPAPPRERSRTALDQLDQARSALQGLDRMISPGPQFTSERVRTILLGLDDIDRTSRQIRAALTTGKITDAGIEEWLAGEPS